MRDTPRVPLKPLYFFITLVSLFFIAGSASALVITSSPEYTINPLTKWEYNVTFTNEEDWRGNLTVTSTLGTDLILQDWNLSYLPIEEDIGLYYVNLTLHDTVATVETYDWQNFTLEVAPIAAIGTDYLILGLVFGFGLIAMGFADRRWLFLGGIVWIYLSLAVFGIYGIPWMIIGLGLGIILFLEGMLSIEKGG